METTPLLHKAVVYGSHFANSAFIFLVAIHALAGAAAVVAGIVALVAKKGRRVHLRAGPLFVYAMVATALTGFVIDVVRLTVRAPANHIHYAGTSMPSSYPARLGFLFAAVCIAYLARLAIPRRARSPGSPSRGWWIAPAALLAIGAGMTLLVIVRFNPWTGALWMIWTFMAAVAVVARYRRAEGASPGPSVEQHRFTMLFLAAFSWWGALQGFGPAIAIAIAGVGSSTEPYVGDRPGAFSPAFFFFLAGWVPTFLVAAFLALRHARKRALRPASA